MKAREVIQNAIDYYKAGGKPGFIISNKCSVYGVTRYPGRCAIGCQLDNPVQLQTLCNEKNIYGIEDIYKEAVAAESILVDDILRLLPEDLTEEESWNLLIDLQHKHDSLCRSITYGHKEETENTWKDFPHLFEEACQKLLQAITEPTAGERFGAYTHEHQGESQ